MASPGTAEMTDDPTKNGEKSNDTRFQTGNPGGPGRPAGSRNKASVLLDQLAEGEAEDILRKQVEKAKEGDQQAAALILSRVWPARKGRAVTLDVPPLEQPADLVAALGAVATAVAEGAITPDEAQAVAAVLEVKRKAIETVDVLARIEALEKERNR
jgi:uncharacterized protein DUF5681